MHARRVVPALDVAKYAVLRLGTGCKVLPMRFLYFQRMPEALHRRVVVAVARAAPRANMTCYTYPREISEQRGRYDDQPADKGPDARSEGFFRSRCIAGSP